MERPSIAAGHHKELPLLSINEKCYYFRRGGISTGTWVNYTVALKLRLTTFPFCLKWPENVRSENQMSLFYTNLVLIWVPIIRL